MESASWIRDGERAKREREETSSVLFYEYLILTTHSPGLKFKRR
jgi:hypothetical protein